MMQYWDDYINGRWQSVLTVLPFADEADARARANGTGNRYLSAVIVQVRELNCRLEVSAKVGADVKKG